MYYLHNSKTQAGTNKPPPTRQEKGERCRDGYRKRQPAQADPGKLDGFVVFDFAAQVGWALKQNTATVNAMEKARAKVQVKETELTNGSMVYDVIVDYGSGHIEFEAINARQADLLGGDLLEVFRRHGFVPA